MKVKDVMTRHVECVGPDETIQAAARKMRDLDVGPMPICDHDRLVGMVTDRDLAVRAVAEGRDPTACHVSEVMTPDVVYCFEDQDVTDAADTMAARQIRRLLVLNRDKRLVGIVSLGDLAVDAGDRRKTAQVLQEVSEPAEPNR
jgi:CBS domain-containing protein